MIQVNSCVGFLFAVKSSRKRSDPFYHPLQRVINQVVSLPEKLPNAFVLKVGAHVEYPMEWFMDLGHYRSAL